MPVISLLFQHGSFTAADTDMNTTALRLYLIGLPFAGWTSLSHTPFTRQDTRTPAIVGVIAWLILSPRGR
jgi:putative peptidoglycan lipid II flippase